MGISSNTIAGAYGFVAAYDYRIQQWICFDNFRFLAVTDDFGNLVRVSHFINISK